MAYFQTENPNLGKFWRVLRWKAVVYFTTIWKILWPFGIHNSWPFGIVCGHLVYCVVIWYIFPALVYCTNINLATPVQKDSRPWFRHGCGGCQADASAMTFRGRERHLLPGDHCYKATFPICTWKSLGKEREEPLDAFESSILICTLLGTHVCTPWKNN
jgi:hypothetical protein